MAGRVKGAFIGFSSDYLEMIQKYKLWETSVSHYERITDDITKIWQQIHSFGNDKFRAKYNLLRQILMIFAETDNLPKMHQLIACNMWLITSGRFAHKMHLRLLH